MDGADGGGMDIRVEPPQSLADLGRPPARLVLLQLHDQLLDLKGELIGVAVGPAAAIGQTLQAAILVAIEDLVAGLARDTELPAERRHLLAIEQSRHETKAFIHKVTLLPRHLCSPCKGPNV